MSKKLLIFDLDGTLLNTIGDLAACCNYMLSQRGLEQHSYSEYCGFVGNGVKRLVERALPEHLRTPEYVDAARKDFVEYYYEHIDDYTMPYMGIVELVSALAAKGVKLAVASNKFHTGTVKLVEKFFEGVEFASVYGNREGFPLKPDPAVLQLIMEQCDATPEDTYMIGDSGVDMQTALAAGVHAVGVSWGFRSHEELKECGAEFIANTTEELMEYFNL